MRASSLPLLLVVLLGLFGYLGYEIYNQQIPCVKPLRYALVASDERFGISDAEIKTDLKQAAAVWNNALGIDALEVSANPDLPVRFVYTKTQANVDTIGTLSTNIDTLKAQLTEVANQYGTLKKQYDALNSKGKATQQMYDELQTLFARYEALRKQINADVAAGQQIPTGEIEEGKYVSDKDGTRIYIYAFQDKTELMRTLTHEFGHALGLDHVANANSIMYPSNNKSTSLALSKEDKAELARVCGITQHSFSGVIYKYIHKVMDIFFARSEIK